MSRIAELARTPLSAAAMRQTMEQIMTGALPAEEVAEFLRTLAQRGEEPEEIAGAVSALWMHQIRLPRRSDLELCDTCGTGGDGQNTFNISTLAAIVAAAAGVYIAKHGNRAASSRCGSADVLEALGLNLNATPEQVAYSVETIGFGFCFAPVFHPAMKVVAPIRKQLGIRTIFNLIGPLANPAFPLTFQLVGVSDDKLRWKIAGALQKLSIRHCLVVRSTDGLDEITTTGETLVAEVGSPTKKPIDHLVPEEYGLQRAQLDQLRGGDVATNKSIAQEVLRGVQSPRFDIVAFNAGCVIYTANQAKTIQEGIAKAIDALKSGRAQTILERAIEISRS